MQQATSAYQTRIKEEKPPTQNKQTATHT